MKLPKKRMLIVGDLATDHRTVLRLFDEDTALPKLQRAVGGFVQSVDLPILGLTMWVNEEGKLNSLPLNYIATAIWNAEFGPTDIILGPVALTGPSDRNGYTKGLADGDIATLSTFFESIRKNLVVLDS